MPMSFLVVDKMTYLFSPIGGQSYTFNITLAFNPYICKSTSKNNHN